MTSDIHSANCDQLWNRLLDAYDAWLFARAALFQHCSDRVVPGLAKALEEPDRQRALALELIPVLPPQQQVELFPTVLQLALFVNGTTILAQKAVMSMPRKWVIENILSTGKNLLAGAEEVYGLVSLCEDIDWQLAAEAADMAASDGRPEIRDAGRECLTRFGK